ncbi:MAG: RHS repeat-associated core domain-containing protein [Nocardioides sp.]
MAAAVLAAAALVEVGVRIPAVASAPAPPVPVDPVPWFSEVTTPGPTVVTTRLLKTDTTWGPEGSPYLIQEDLQIDQNTALTLLPGTVIKMGLGRRISVIGQLLSLGTPGARVTITSIRDDSVMGDSNGDGAATVPARDDWLHIDVSGNYIGQVDKPLGEASIFDYTDFRHGGGGTIINCTVDSAMLQVGNPDSGKLLVSNSTFSQGVSGIRTRSNGTTGFVGVYNSTFSDLECGILSFGGRDDIVANHFASSISLRAFIGNNPERVRFWYNTVQSPFSSAGGPVEARFNTFVGGIANYPGSTTKTDADLRNNWWGANLNGPLPRCLTQAAIQAYQPPVSYSTDAACPSDRRYSATAHRNSVTPSLSTGPNGMPQAVTRAHSPRFGSVDTGRGALIYSVEDMKVEDAGKTLKVERTYSSRPIGLTDNGDGWRASFGEALSTSVNGVADFTSGDGDSLPFAQDPSGEVVQQQGNASSYSTDATGSSVTTPDDVTYSFDAAGGLSSMLLSDPGHKVDVDRENGRVRKVTGSSGRTITYARNGSGRVDSVSDSADRTVSYAYTDGNLTSATGVDGQATTYTYSGTKLTKVTSPNGVVELAAGYDDADRVAWVEEQGSGRSTIEYDGDRRVITRPDDTRLIQTLDVSGRLLTETVRGADSVRHLVYDGESRVVADIQGIPKVPMAGYSPPAAAVHYDKGGNPVVQVDPVGRATATEYNGRGKPTKVTTTADAITSYTYGPHGRLQSVVDPRGKTWAFTHTGRGQVASITDPVGRTRTWGYEPDGDISTYTSELGAATSFETNGRGLVTDMRVDPGEGGAIRHTSFAYTAWDAIRRITKPRTGEYSVGFREDRRQTNMTTPIGTTTYGYDPRGRLATLVDPAGGSTTMAYDTSGRLASTMNPRGKIATQSYDAEGNLKRTDGPAGSVQIYSYDPAGRQVRLRDSADAIRQVVLDRSGAVVRTDQPDGTSSVFTYATNGQVDTHVNSLGGKSAYEYNLAGAITKITDPRGSIETRTYDDLGRPESQVDFRGTTVNYAYTNLGRTTTISDIRGMRQRTHVNRLGEVSDRSNGAGETTTYAYDTDGNLAKEVRPGGLETSYTYDLAGNVVGTTNARDKTTLLERDPMGRVEVTTHPDLTTEEYTYDLAGNLSTYTNQANNTWTYTYDPLNKPDTLTDPRGGVTDFDYDALGQLQRTTDQTGVWTDTDYDPVGRPAVVTRAGGGASQFAYDGEGNLISSTDAMGRLITYRYNNNNELTDEIFPSGIAKITYAYDKSGNVITRTRGTHIQRWTYDVRDQVASHTDGTGFVTTLEYDLAGRGVQIAAPDGGKTTFGYDLAGNLARASQVSSTGAGPDLTTLYNWYPTGELKDLTRPRGGVYSYQIDAMGRTTQETRPGGRAYTFGYDDIGSLDSMITPSSSLTMTHDEWGRETGRSGATQQRAYTYDGAGRLRTATTSGADGSTNLGFTYDATSGLLKTSTDSVGTTNYTHDGQGMLASSTAPSGDTLSYTYNAVGQVSTVRGTVNVDYGYTSNGWFTGRSMPTGTSTKYAGYTVSNDADGRPRQISGSTAFTFTNTFDSAGRTKTAAKSIGGVTHVDEGTTTYSYDEYGRISSTSHDVGGTVQSTASFAWDEDSNRRRVDRTSNGTTTTETLTHDVSGRISSGTTAAGSIGYTYNDAGQLTGIDQPGTTAGDTTYAYDDFGLLSAATVIGAAGQPKTTSYARDAFGRVTEATSGGTSVAYGYTSLQNQPSTVTTGAGTTQLLRDAQGTLLSAKSPTGVISHAIPNLHGDQALWRAQSNGALISATLYDPFGLPSTVNGTGVGPGADLGVGFQQMLTDSSTGLVDMTARTYAAALGAFTTEDDVIGLLSAPSTLNRYMFGNGQPLDYIDPTGHWPDWGDVSNAFSSAWDQIRNTGQDLYNAVSSGASSAYESVSSGVSNAYQAVSSAASQAAGVASSALSQAQSGLKSLQSKAGGYANQALRTGQNVGQQLSNGYTQTIAMLGGSSQVHEWLDRAGYVPVLGQTADVINTGLYLLEGDLKSAMIAGIALAPYVGNAAKLAVRNAEFLTKPLRALPSPSNARSTLRSFGGSPNALPNVNPKAIRAGGDGGSDLGRFGARSSDEPLEGAANSAAPMDTFLASGARVSESRTATAIGDDANTMQNFARSRGAGGHDVIVHGDTAGNFVVNGNITHPQQIADAVLGNPGYRGGPINLVTCHGACGAAQELSEIMGVPVNSMSGLVDLDPVTGLLRSLG